MKAYFKLLVFSVFILASATFSAQNQQDEDSPKKKAETKLTEVIMLDSLPPGELVKRAGNWMKLESKSYVKSKGSINGSKAECTATFLVKPKDLNPQVDYTGKITMNVVIECKDNRYKYTISDIKHTSRNGKATAGSIDNVVPDCGSMGMDDIVWKKLKGEAIRGATQVATDLKAGMSQDSANVTTDEW